MDDTIDALTSRLKGRHLLDEAIGFIRRSSSGNGGAKLRAKAGESANAVLHTVADTVKAHPLPASLIGAGLAWLVYEKSRPSLPEAEYDPDYDARREAGFAYGWEEDVAYDNPPLDAPEPGEAVGSGLPGSEDFYDETSAPSDEASGGTASAAKEKMRHLKQRLSSKTGPARQRGREGARVVGQRVHDGYAATRRRVATTVEHRPLESGIACLALGVLAGLLIPVPRAVGEIAGPTAERLRQRAREAGHDWVERGKHIAEAALSAAREEAGDQGLTPEELKQKAGSVAEHAREAAAETAREEGIAPSGKNTPPGE